MDPITDVIKCIKDGSKTKEIRMSHLSLNTDACTVLIHTLSNDHSIKSLIIYSCSISKIDLIQFASHLKDFGLDFLDLGYVGMDNEDVVKAIATGIQGCGIKKLYIPSNRLGPKGTKYIAAALRNCEVVELNMYNNSIQAEGVAYITKVLAEGNTKLKVLYMSNNDIGDEGCLKLAEALPMTKLEALYLNRNNITEVGFIRLGQTIQKSNTMVKLVIDYNDRLSNVGADAFLKLIKTHRTLSYVDLWGSRNYGQMQVRIDKHLETLHSVKSQLLVRMVAANCLHRLRGERMLPTDLLRRLKEWI
jgi:hypothetical protein